MYPATRRILVLPAHRLWREWTGQPPDDDEDRELSYRILAQRGIGTRRLDVHCRPWNPFSQSHTLLRAIDPVRALRVLLFERRAEVVFCFFEAAALLILLLRRLFRFRGRVVVVDVGGYGWRLRRMIQDIVIPRADAVLPYSALQAVTIRQIWPTTQLVQPLQASVDCRFFACSPDCPSGPVLAVGDDISRDYATLLQAAIGLKHHLVIRSRLVPLNAGTPAITILTEPLSTSGYRDLISAAAIVVLPLHISANSGAGGVSVLVQAMSSGKAVVVSASPGISEYVTDGVDALVVPCGDAVALRNAITRLLTDAPLRQRLGMAARAKAVRFNSMEAWAAQLEAVMQCLASKTVSPEAVQSGEPRLSNYG